MVKKYSNSVTKYIILIPVIALVLLSTVLISIVISNQNHHLEDDIKQLRTTYVNDINKIINTKIEDARIQYKEQNRLLIFLAILTTLSVITVTIILARNIASKLNQTNRDLEKKVNEQNIELHMIVANKTIQNIEQSKIMEKEQLKNIKFTAIGQLAAGITHEINTPLTYIKGNFEMIKYDIQDLPDGIAKERILEDSEKVMDGINRLSNIVESMREMSQKSKESKENVNIYHTLITSLTLLYNRSKQISKIKLNGELFKIGFDKDKELYVCCVQKQRVEQTWVIIINNALDELVKIDNFEDRLIDINIKCTDDNKNIVIKIKDNAGGIPNDINENIFEPFVSTKESSGMGVGLNIAKKIIEDQNGIIRAYNEDDGAVFEIRLGCGSCSAKC